MSTFLQALNSRQQQAVYHDEGGALVLAGAGTGKTRVLTGRIFRLLNEQKAAPHEILAVTFTNKAANEMKARLNVAMQGRLPSMMIGTFHGICHRILRQHAVSAGLDKNFQILDAQDQLTFIRRLLREKNISDKDFTPNDVRWQINNWKDAGHRANSVTINHSRQNNFLEMYALYEKKCQQENKVDFSELLLATLELWKKDESIRKHYSERFCHILVDELQDTNQQQFTWLQLLDSKANHYFGVGDDDQSIYAFRGAEPKIMQRFQSQLRAYTLIRLEENYRSVKTILDAANGLIRKNSQRLGKTLRASLGEGEKITVQVMEDEIQEAETVAIMIKGQIHQKIPPQEIAVLYRTNAQARLIERALMAHGVAYRVYGGQRFYDRMEIKHALAYLRLLGSDDYDSFFRVVNFPPRGIGAKAIELLQSDNDLWHAFYHSTHAKVIGFRGLLGDLRQHLTHPSLPEIVRIVIEKSQLLDYYEQHNEKERADNIRELVNAAAQFADNFIPPEETRQDSLLNQFLANVALESGGDDSTEQQTVSLMTVHAAKGLEFSSVHIVGLEEGLFPHENSLDMPQTLEEERRLMYVAITRAKNKLALYYAQRRLLYGKTVFNPSSRFLRELPSDCLHDASCADPHRTAPAKVARPALNADISSNGFRPGDGVNHKRYGDGIVLGRSGAGKDLKIEVMFKKHGKKTFVVALAPLQKI